jgi:hypothetical protein
MHEMLLLTSLDILTEITPAIERSWRKLEKKGRNNSGRLKETCFFFISSYSTRANEK